MLDLLMELLANRLGVIILGGMFIAGGVYTWQTYRQEARLYDTATGSESRTVEGKVVWKNQERTGSGYSDDGSSTLVDYFTVEFEHDGESQRVKLYVDSSEYAAYKEGDPIEVKYHPFNLEYIVTPTVERESVWLASTISIMLTAIGGIIVIAVLASFL